MLLYIDISAVSTIVPIIAGIAVAIGSWVYLRYRRAKSKVTKTLGIDENAGKEVEEDIILTDDAAETESTDSAADAENKQD